MTEPSKNVDEIDSLEEAKARIVLLEKKLDEAIELILKRDAQLEAAERRIFELGGDLGEGVTGRG
jgi:hypothetical protein